MRPLGRNKKKKKTEQDLLNLFCLWKQDAAEVTVLFMVVTCFVAYGGFTTVQN